MDSALLIDNGLNLIIFLRQQVDQELLAHILGVSSLEELEDFTNVPEVESDFNLRLHSIINRLREMKGNSTQQIKIVLEDQKIDISKNFVESHNTMTNSNYWDFLSQLHEQVKDD